MNMLRRAGQFVADHRYPVAAGTVGAGVGGGAVAMLGNWGSNAEAGAGQDGSVRGVRDPENVGIEAMQAGYQGIRQGTSSGVPPAAVDPEEYDKVMKQMAQKLERSAVEAQMVKAQIAGLQQAKAQRIGQQQQPAK